MVDTIDSKSIAFWRGGSSPLQGKYVKRKKLTKEHKSLINSKDNSD